MNRVYQLHARLIKTLDPISLRNLLLFSCAATTPVLCYIHAVFVEHAPSIHDAFSWNTMIRAHANSFLPFPALSFFSHMRLRGIPPDHYTFPLLLKACSLSGASEMGRAAHSLVTKLGFGSDVHVGNSLVSFYAGLGLVNLAVHTFDEMPHRDTVSWSAVIDCLTTNGLDHDALAAFLAMQVSGGPATPDEVTMVSVISAVGNTGASELGMWVYSYVRRRGLYLTVSMGTALIVMFSKCGYINHAAEVFDVMPIKNVRTWTALINGFAAHGKTIEALRTFRRMKEEGFEPDHITFIGVLTACSHGGLLEEGTRLFHSIEGVHGMVPWIEHYGCMVDMMGRAGLVKEAHEFVKKMPIRPNSVIWRTLLGACVSHAYVELAEQVKEEILKLDPDHDGNYVLLSNAYGGIGRWDEKAALRLTMRDRGIEKTPGCSLPY